MIEFHSCFISYSHRDEEFATKLCDLLTSHGVSCWLDRHELTPGDDMFRAVDEAIRTFDKLILCCSENSLNSWWVNREIENVLTREMKVYKTIGRAELKIIPVLLDDSFHEWDGPNATELRRRLALDARNWRNDQLVLEKAVGQLLKAIRVGELAAISDEGDVPEDDTGLAGPLRVLIDSDAYSAVEKGELLSLISELYELQGGDRLVIDGTGTAEVLSEIIIGPEGGQG